MHNHIPPTAQAATAETISNWFDELAEVVGAIVADSGNRGVDRRPKLKLALGNALDIAECVVTDLNRIATAQEAIAKLLLQADRRGSE
jgi:predicted ATPase